MARILPSMLQFGVVGLAFLLGAEAWAEEPAATPKETPAKETPAADPAPAEEATPTPEAEQPKTGLNLEKVAPSGPMRLEQAVLPTAPPPEDDLPIPTLSIDRVPPNTSYEVAIQGSFGEVAFFRDTVPATIGFGVRAGWGKHFGLHRLGLAGTLAGEGDLGIHSLIMAEPSFAWDFVARKGLLLGAHAGPSFGYWANAEKVVGERGFFVMPEAAARVGWSQGWSRVGRRIFVFVEPKLRYAPDGLQPVVALAVGSGNGR